MEIQLADGTVIVVQEGQKLAELPLEYQQVVLQALAQGDFTKDELKYMIDIQGITTALLVMELQDRLIARMSLEERKYIEELGLRGIFDYGNFSTWINRLRKVLELVQKDNDD